MELKLLGPLLISSPAEELPDDDEVVQRKEVKELISFLPKEKGVLHLYTYQYQGFWFSHISLRAITDFQQHFRPHKNDILLVTPPKSGTTWLKAILYALNNRETYHPQHAHHPLLTKTPHQLIPFLEFLMPSEYESISNSSDSSTRIFSCHIPAVSLPMSVMEQDGCKIVFLCRDIKDTFVSLFHFVNRAKLRPSPISLEDAFDSFCRGVAECGPIWDQILGYWKLSREMPHKVLFMRYEEMKTEPHSHLRRLAHFLGKPFTQKEESSGLVDQIINLCSFDSMSNLEVNKTGNLVYELRNNSFFRSGNIGDGEKYLTADMAAKLDQITDKMFSGSGFSL